MSLILKLGCIATALAVSGTYSGLEDSFLNSPSMQYLILITTLIVILFRAGDDNKTGQNLDCTHNCTDMNCQFEAQNCSEYNLILQSNDGYG